MTEEEYSKFEKRFETVCRKFRRFKFDDVLKMVITYIHRCEASYKENALRSTASGVVWLHLLLLKFAACNCEQSSHRRKLTHQRYAQLYNSISNVQAPYHLSMLDQGIASMMAAMLPAQMDFQTNLSTSHVARLHYLFCSSPHFEKYFIETYNISPNLLAQMQVTIAMIGTVYDINKASNHVKILNTAFSKEEIIHFYSALCKTPKELIDTLVEHDERANRNIYKMNDVSPIVNYPFLLKDNKLTLISYHALQSSVYKFFFNEVKSSGNDRLSRELANKFEHYLTEVLRSGTSKEIFTEKELEKKYNIEAKSKTDALLLVNDTAISFEFKSTALSGIAQFAPTPQTVFRALKKSVTKGITQGFNLAKTIKKSGDATNFIHLVVTYSPICLGPPPAAWETYFKEKFEKKFAQGELDPTLLPPENIFVISIDELCQLALCAYNNNGDYLYILTEIIKRNSNPETSSFDLTIHLSEWEYKCNSLPFIQNEAEKFYDKILSRLPQ